MEMKGQTDRTIDRYINTYSSVYGSKERWRRKNREKEQMGKKAHFCLGTKVGWEVVCASLNKLTQWLTHSLINMTQQLWNNDKNT